MSATYKDPSFANTIPSIPPPAGTVLGGEYLLGEKLGEGGFGAVYAAEHRLTKRQVAVKVLSAELSRDPEAVQRFLHEARAATALAHPNIVDVLDMGFDETRGAFLVMERLTGESLRDHLARRGRLSPGEAIAILLPVARALAEAHDRGVVHRDLKPDNIFLARTRGSVVPKVLDFGIAKVSRQIADTTLRTRVGAVMGTPSYMSPELMSAADEATPAADVWALGAVLYELVTGVVPFGGANLTALFFAISQGEYVRASEQPNSTATKELDRVIGGCLHRDAGARFPNARTFAEALEDLPEHRASHADQTGVVVAQVLRRERIRHVVAMVAGAAVIFGLWAGVSKIMEPSAPIPWLTIHSEYPEGAIDRVLVRSVTSDGTEIDSESWPVEPFPFSVELHERDPRTARVEVIALGVDHSTIGKAKVSKVGFENGRLVMDAVLAPQKLAAR
jgi:serine/threonine protein kinase